MLGKSSNCLPSDQVHGTVCVEKRKKEKKGSR